MPLGQDLLAVLAYVGDGRAFRRVPAEDLTDGAIAEAAARTLQRPEDLVRDLIASGLYVESSEPEPKAKKRK